MPTWHLTEFLEWLSVLWLQKRFVPRWISNKIRNLFRCSVFIVRNLRKHEDHTKSIGFLYARLVGLYYGMARASVCLSLRPSVCLSVHKACKHDTDWTVAARTVKLGTHTTYDKRTNLIDFQGQGSKVKVTAYTLLLNLVNTIQTELFKASVRHTLQPLCDLSATKIHNDRRGRRGVATMFCSRSAPDRGLVADWSATGRRPHRDLFATWCDWLPTGRGLVPD